MKHLVRDSIGLGIQAYSSAATVPFGNGRRKGASRPAGVFSSDGSYLEAAQCFRSDRLPTTVQPDGGAPQNDMRFLPGRWLFGGMLYQHFGHFLIESTSRLWAIDHIDDPVDGVLFFPRKKMTWEERFVRPIMPWLGQFGKEFKKAVAPKDAVRVEELVVAPQAFGAGQLMSGTPAYRDFIRARLGSDIPAEGAEKIYVSRTRLNSKRGRYLGEQQIEGLLEDEGYRIFHPQAHSLEQQIAQYKAAKMIVSSDNSALHLAAFFCEPEDRIAIIRRRGGNLIGDFRLQFNSFAGSSPEVIDAMDGRVFQREGSNTVQMSEVYTALDLPNLGDRLCAEGFITDANKWPVLDEGLVRSELAQYEKAMGCKVVQTGL